MNIRKWIKILHRDIGYLSVGLTIIYAVSGMAVNHIDQWNPNYIIENETVQITPLTDSSLSNESMAAHIQNELSYTDTAESYFRTGPNSIQLFYDKKNIDADLKNGTVNIETIKNRSVLREMNFLHLNNPKKIWTYVADIFAFCLILLAVTGMFMLKNKNGLWGRGKYFVTAGILIPVIFLFFYF